MNLLLVLILILWMFFLIMTGSALFYAKPRSGKILGAALSRVNMQHSDTQALLRRYRISCFTVLVVSMALSLLLIIKPISLYAESLIIIPILVNVVANLFIIQHTTQKLFELKDKHGWIYSRKRVVAVDLNVTRQKGNAGISAVFVFLFFALSFIPTVFLLIYPEKQQIYPVFLSFTGPFCLLVMIAFYYQLKNKSIPAYSKNSVQNQAYAAQSERLGTIAGTLASLAMLVFWLAFCAGVIFVQNAAIVMVSAILLVAALMGVSLWHRKKSEELENKLWGEIADGQLYEEKNLWTWGFYNNPNDSRVVVPKRIESMGWTINIGHPAGKLIGAGILLFVAVVFGVILYSSTGDYQFIEAADSVTIDAPMYDITIKKSDIVSVSVSDRMPAGRRTNGYGGGDKNFGHFNLNEYGPAMVYIYHRAGRFVVVELSEQNPQYVVVSGKTAEETDSLYQDFLRWEEDGKNR